MSWDDQGQIYTLEGLAAVAILIGLLLFIIQSVSIATPQTEMTMDLKLQQNASDMLLCIDRINETGESDLKNYILNWNGHESSWPEKAVDKDLEGSIYDLDRLIDSYTPPEIAYNVDILYIDEFNGKKRENLKQIIRHGDPNDNSVMVKKLVTINRLDDMDPAGFWKTANRFPQIVEVRLTVWYI